MLKKESNISYNNISYKFPDSNIKSVCCNSDIVIREYKHENKVMFSEILCKGGNCKNKQLFVITDKPEKC